MDISPLLWIALLSLSTLRLLYVPDIRIGLNLADEGYLWHGTQRVISGATPIRDFRAYDPGRYFWCAWWLRLLGSSLFSLRVALQAAQAIALGIAASSIYIVSSDWIITTVATLTLAMGMHPRHKQFDSLLSALSVLTALLLAIHAVPQQFLFSGIVVGCLVLLGLNHAVYAGGGLLLLIHILAFKEIGPGYLESLEFFTYGLAIGLIPTAIAFVLSPGFFIAYWKQKVVRIFRRGAANLPLPIPWIWSVPPAHLGHHTISTITLIRLKFTIIPLYYTAIILYVVFGPSDLSAISAALLSSTCIGIFYLHHMLSRADLEHLLQSILPFIVSFAILLSGWSFGWIVLIGLLLMSYRDIYKASDDYIAAHSSDIKLQTINVAGTEVTVSDIIATHLLSLKALVDKYSEPEDRTFFAPTLVTLYPLFSREPAVYDTFCVYTATDEEQLCMIEQMKSNNLSLAIIDDYPLDSRDDLRFCHTHPQVWRYLREMYHHKNTEGLLPACYSLFIKEEHTLPRNESDKL